MIPISIGWSGFCWRWRSRRLGKSPNLLGDPAPGVSFDPAFGDFALGFTLGFQVTEFADQYGVRNALRKRVLQRFRAEGIRIPFPTRTIYIEGHKNEGDKGRNKPELGSFVRSLT